MDSDSQESRRSPDLDQQLDQSGQQRSGQQRSGQQRSGQPDLGRAKPAWSLADLQESTSDRSRRSSAGRVRILVRVTLLVTFVGLLVWGYGRQAVNRWCGSGTADLLFGPKMDAALCRTEPSEVPLAQGTGGNWLNLSNAIIPTEEIRSGGPPKDGIPALSDPNIVPASQATFLRPGSRVIGVVLGGQPRAYPLAILNWHECVNDVLGKRPIAVTYCPLCDSAAVFDRRIARLGSGTETKTDSQPSNQKTVVCEFGISGRLYNSNVLLYDRSDPGQESLWSQVMAQAVTGPQAGQKLRALPLELTTWSQWQKRHPKTDVLSTSTGHRRNYQRNSYTNYLRSSQLMFPVKPIDRRLPLKMPVLGLWVENSSAQNSSAQAIAVPLGPFASQAAGSTVSIQVGKYQAEIAYHPESGSLSVVKADKPIQWMYAFWFAWASLQPETDIAEPPP